MKFALVELGEPLTAEEQEEKEKLLEEVRNRLAFCRDYMLGCLYISYQVDLLD